MAVRPRPDMVKLKHGFTQTPLSGETHAWNPSDLVSSSMASPRLSSSFPFSSLLARYPTIKVRLASYLEIRPLGLTMAVRPRADMVKLKHGITQTPLSGETQAWNPSDLVSSSMASPRLSSSFFLFGETQVWNHPTKRPTACHARDSLPSDA